MKELKNLSLFRSSPLVNETIIALELSLKENNIKSLRQKIENNLLKYPGPGNRKRHASEIIRRFISYDKSTFEIKITPLIRFVSLKNIPYRAKVQVLYYYYTKAHPIVFEVFKVLSRNHSHEFSNKELKPIVSMMLGKPVEKEHWGLRIILYSLCEFSLVERISPGKYKVIQQYLEPIAFLFVLYNHFLSEGSVVPKIMDIKIFFKELYNQTEEETERFLRNLAQEGWWAIERMAHLDQVALTYNSMDRFMEAFLKKYQRVEDGSNVISEGSKN